MTDIRFYHLQKQPLDQALPRILGKALSAGHKVVVKMPDEQEIERMNALLWVYHPDSFLPHGSKKDGYAQDQPIWLTDKDENPNKADVLILTGGVTAESVDDYSMACEMLDGRSDEAVSQARQRWKVYRDSGHEVTYWKQSDQGGWEKKT